MASSEDRPTVVDVMSCDLIGEMQLDIRSIIDKNVNFNDMSPIICSVYHIKSELILQITLKFSEKTGMIDANLEVLGGATDNLRFKIKYGFWPFLQYRPYAQIFIYTATKKRSDDYSICNFSDLLEFIVDNELKLKNQDVEFMATITISRRDTTALISKYQIPTVNASDCDHTLICQGHAIKTHKYILMGTSRWFLRRFTENPLFKVTILDRLEEIDQRIEREVLACLLRFMYGMTISDHNLRTTKLLSAARAFEVNKLLQTCEDSLIKQLSPDMAPELFYIGKTEGVYRLMIEAAKYISANYLAVKERYEWDAIMRTFPTFFEEIKPNPLKYFRGILHPESRSEGDLLTRIGVSFLLTKPEIVITPPMHTSKDETKSEKTDDETETTTIDESIGSEDDTLFECQSLDFDLEPIPRKRSSPVVSRRRSDSSALGALRRSESLSSSSSLDAFRMKSLQDALPKMRFSREALTKMLLANEPKFDEDFGPVESRPGPTRGLFRTTSLPVDDKFRLQDRSGEEYKSTVRAHSEQKYKMKLHKNRFDMPMDCREDSKMVESTDSTKNSSNSPRSIGPGTLSGVQHYTTTSLTSKSSSEFGFTYSYSSDSEFEQASPKPVPSSGYRMEVPRVPTPPQDMSVSEISSRFHDISPSPKLMNRFDFGLYTYPEARTPSDISSIPLDPSTSLEPDTSSSSRTRNRREKRLKKSSENKRKLPSGAATFHSSSTEGSIGIIPRPTFSKEISTGKRHFPSHFHQKKGIRKISPVSSSEMTSSESMPSKKVTFGETDYVQTFAEDVEFNETELKATKYYENWLDTASFYNIHDFYNESPSSNVEDFEEKPWDEKDEEELTAPLLEKVNKQRKKESSSSSSASDAVEFPPGGGVIRKTPGRKTPGRFSKSSVDDPAPLSTSSESGRTTSSSMSPVEYKKCVTEMLADLYATVQKKPKQKEIDTSSNLVRTQSYTDLRTVLASPTEPSTDTKEDVQNVKSESSDVADVKPEVEKDPQ